jgi:hypothetical protein
MVTMQRVNNTPPRKRSLPRCANIAVLALCLLAGPVVIAAERPSGSQHGGAARPFNAPSDFHEIADRNTARFFESNAPAAMTACLAGCYNGPGAGVVEEKIEGYEILTSAGIERVAPMVPVAATPVRIALNESVQCIAGCSAIGIDRVPARAQTMPHVNVDRTLAMLKPHRPHRAVGRFAMSGRMKGDTAVRLQRRAGLASAVARTAIR